LNAIASPAVFEPGLGDLGPVPDGREGRLDRVGGAHTSVHRPVGADVDLVLIAKARGHASLDTIRLPNLSAEEDKQASLDGLAYRPATRAMIRRALFLASPPA
jgi:hypothetical protein